MQTRRFYKLYRQHIPGWNTPKLTWITKILPPAAGNPFKKSEHFEHCISLQWKSSNTRFMLIFTAIAVTSKKVFLSIIMLSFSRMASASKRGRMRKSNQQPTSLTQHKLMTSVNWSKPALQRQSLSYKSQYDSAFWTEIKMKPHRMQLHQHQEHPH